MAPESTPVNKPNQGNHREIKDLASALTHRLSKLHYMGKSIGRQDGDHEEDQDHLEKGASIITLAGSNTGATMQGEYLEETAEAHGFSHGDDVQEVMTTYANSNFQAINNSIMFNSNYSCDDPGVHIETTEFLHEDPASYKLERHEKKEKKKKKVKGSSKSDDSSSEESSDDHGKP